MIKRLVDLLSRLPMPVLYGIGGFFYFLAFYVVRHRHRVIQDQLAKVFPDRTPDERTRIHKQFLKNFCDVIMELVKSASMSEDQMRARVPILNMEVARAHLSAGKSVMLVTSHLGNWEWLLQAVALELGYPIDAAYKPLHDPWAERLMLKMRTRFGARLIPAKELLGDFLRRKSIVRALAMNADQAPVSTDKRYWTRFLGQDTAFYIGAEQIARATRLPVIYVGMRRVARGRYEVRLKELWDGRETLDANGITERYARACEIDVLDHPADWLWSYRRWRLQKPLYGAD
ncbi:MAG TPA: lysophospholipid acyltransferase family protein [Steroidobacteraceae bacterium]|jgi:KDO2-lipid IV(A) lauroyltransferase|nr:lysophospholipid acyltransferase family protein [Steroidobacteraceae bacterium]